MPVKQFVRVVKDIGIVNNILHFVSVCIMYLLILAPV